MEYCPKINILMSTYNGEKYLKEQLDSLLNQTYKNIKIYIRDDGSSDNTLNILKEYNKENKINLFVGENIGFVKSFFWLIKNSDNADYYSFSDQDDVWFPGKLEKAINLLNKYDSQIPTLYFSNFDYYDSE
ncbi:MAG TPA: glycosyltransferase, partial [Spirochaetota bacterium]|nr:glycosyltransferase [Spirochaetota bacterium]